MSIYAEVWVYPYDSVSYNLVIEKNAYSAARLLELVTQLLGEGLSFQVRIW